MKLIVGLGNPGREYEATRHNLGFMLIDRLSERAECKRFRDEANAKVAEVTLASERVLLVKPQTYMNLSGGSVRPLLERYGEAESGKSDCRIRRSGVAIRHDSRSRAGQRGRAKRIEVHYRADWLSRVSARAIGRKAGSSGQRSFKLCAFAYT